MNSVAFCFRIHQPYLVKKYRVFDVGHDAHYFNDESCGILDNRHRLTEAARTAYIPATERLLSLLDEHPQLMVGFVFSGVVLEQLEQWAPDALALFARVVDTGQVEIAAESYYHSHAYRTMPDEYEKQIHKHGEIVWRLFGVHPRAFYLDDAAPIEYAEWLRANEYMTLAEMPEEIYAEQLADIARQYASAHMHPVALLRDKDPLQTAALDAVYALGPAIVASGDPQIKETWRRLQSADHFHAMTHASHNDGEPSPYDVYMSYMHALNDLQTRV